MGGGFESGNSGIYAYTPSRSAWGAVREAQLTTSTTHPSRKHNFGDLTTNTISLVGSGPPTVSTLLTQLAQSG